MRLEELNQHIKSLADRIRKLDAEAVSVVDDAVQFATNVVIAGIGNALEQDNMLEEISVGARRHIASTIIAEMSTRLEEIEKAIQGKDDIGTLDGDMIARKLGAIQDNQSIKVDVLSESDTNLEIQASIGVRVPKKLEKEMIQLLETIGTLDNIPKA
jgi:hypothetical protein